MILWYIAGLVLCFVLSAFFSSAELAYSSCSRLRLYRYEESETVKGRSGQCAALRRHDRQHRIAGIPLL